VTGKATPTILENIALSFLLLQAVQAVDLALLIHRVVEVAAQEVIVLQLQERVLAVARLLKTRS
jgi:hypothetical protein